MTIRERLQQLFDVQQPTKDIQSNQKDAPRFLSRSATTEQRTRHYIENRWHEQYNYYLERSTRNRRQHLRLQLFIAVVAVAVPVLLGFNAELISFTARLAETDGWYSGILNQATENNWISFLNAVPAILSGMVAGATALENVQKYGDNWRAFQTAADGLERERALFEANSGPYRTAPNAYRLFVERSEDVISQETGRYFARESVQGTDDMSDEDVFESLMGSSTDTDLVYDDADVSADQRSYGASY